LGLDRRRPHVSVGVLEEFRSEYLDMLDESDWDSDTFEFAGSMPMMSSPSGPGAFSGTRSC
jgi:hypothetical protein